MSGITVRKLISVLGYRIDDKPLQKYDKQLGGIGKKMASIAKGAAVAGIALTAVAGAAFLTKLVSVNQLFQKLQGQLTSVTGSLEAGRSAFGMLRTFAKETPFQLQELVQAFTKLRAVGINPTAEDMRSFGDITSFADVEGGVIKFAESVQSAVAGSFEPMRQFGIFIAKEGKNLNVTVDGQTTAIKNNAKSLAAFLATTGKGKFAGSMARQMDTIGGKFSNMSDQMFEFFVTVGESGASEAFARILDFVLKLGGASGDLAKSIGSKIGDGLNMVADGLIWAETKWDSFESAVIAGFNLFMNLPFLLYLDDLAVFFAGGDSMIGDFFDSPQVQTFLAAMDALINESIPKLKAGWDELLVSAKELAVTLEGGEALEHADGLTALLSIMLKLAEATLAIAGGFLWLANIITQVVDFISPIFGPVLQFWLNVWEFFFVAVSAIFGFFIDALVFGWEFAGNQFTAFLHLLTGDFDAAIKNWMASLQGFTDLLGGIGIDVSSITGSAPSASAGNLAGSQPSSVAAVALAPALAGAGAGGTTTTVDAKTTVGAINVTIAGTTNMDGPAVGTAAGGGVKEAAKAIGDNRAGA